MKCPVPNKRHGQFKRTAEQKEKEDFRNQFCKEFRKNFCEFVKSLFVHHFLQLLLFNVFNYHPGLIKRPSPNKHQSKSYSFSKWHREHNRPLMEFVFVFVF